MTMNHYPAEDIDMLEPGTMPLRVTLKAQPRGPGIEWQADRAWGMEIDNGLSTVTVHQPTLVACVKFLMENFSLV